MPGLDAHSPGNKLGGYEFYEKVLGSPRYVVAPMVDQSELAWRKLSRRYGAQLVYTPMINAKLFAEGSRKPYRDQNFCIPLGQEGGPEDRPLIVQFCANDPSYLLTAAKIVEPHCDAVDINLGCPQDIARRGRYGSFLQDEWDLIYELINTLHRNLSVPVTAKFRVFPTVEKTVEYAKMLERAGAQILTCHGRTREQRGSNSGLADWEKIRAVKAAVSVPVFANGNILFHSDIERCLEATGADAVMSAEGNLYNPAIFCPPLPPPPIASTSTSTSILPTQPTSPLDRPFIDSPPDDTLPSTWMLPIDTGLHPPHTKLALEYLSIVKSLATPTSPSAVKGHLFKLLRPALSRETDLREQLGRVRVEKGRESGWWSRYEEIVREMDARMLRDARAAEGRSAEELVSVDPSTGIKVLPHWLAQPYFRPLSAASGGRAKIAAASLQLLESKPSESEDAEDAETTTKTDAELALVGKRALCERTPEPDELSKRARLASDEIVTPPT